MLVLKEHLPRLPLFLFLIMFQYKNNKDNKDKFHSLNLMTGIVLVDLSY